MPAEDISRKSSALKPPKLTTWNSALVRWDNHFACSNISTDVHPRPTAVLGFCTSDKPSKQEHLRSPQSRCTLWPIKIQQNHWKQLESSGLSSAWRGTVHDCIKSILTRQESILGGRLWQCLPMRPCHQFGSNWFGKQQSVFRCLLLRIAGDSCPSGWVYIRFFFFYLTHSRANIQQLLH